MAPLRSSQQCVQAPGLAQHPLAASCSDSVKTHWLQKALCESTSYCVVVDFGLPPQPQVPESSEEAPADAPSGDVVSAEEAATRS